MIPYEIIYIKMLMLVIVRLSKAKLKFWWHYVNWFNVYFLLHFLLGLMSYQFEIYKWLFIIYMSRVIFKPELLHFYYQNSCLHLKTRVCICTEMKSLRYEILCICKNKIFYFTRLIKALKSLTIFSKVSPGFS